MKKCIVIIATQNIRETLYSRALKSIREQTVKPKQIIIINDNIPFSDQQKKRISSILDKNDYEILSNNYTKGAAGAWNSALKYISTLSYNGYIAILDDDDEWDKNHLELNLRIAQIESSDVVVSGLRIIKDGIHLSRELPNQLLPKHFLIENPGWQGSNTFVLMKVFKMVKGFRNGLLSTNDRDLAFRILCLSNIKISYTNRWTSTWYIDSKYESLSSSKSESKLEGLRWFWYIYNSYFDEKDRNVFFERAWKLFKITKKNIITIEKNKPKQKNLFGDLDVI